MIVLKAIDAHVGGEPLRLIVDGFPSPLGKTMAEKREWAMRHAHQLRRALMLEPRGHADMYGALLTEPTTPGSHAGLLFMHNDGYSTMCGHGIIAVATIALERGLILPGGDGRSLTFDTPAGSIRAIAHWARKEVGRAGGAGEAGGTATSGGRLGAEVDPASLAEARDGIRRVGAEVGRVERVAFVNVPSFVLQGGVDVAVGARRVRVDIAFGGVFYAIVDGESVGLPLDGAHLSELRRVGAEIMRTVDATVTVVHPLDPRLSGVCGTIFTGPPQSGSADLRNVTVFANAEVDRSACGTGTAAVMAVLSAMGLLDDRQTFVHESIIGTTFTGRVVGRTAVGDYSAIVPQIEGSAWITGEHTFIVDRNDPLRDGFKL